MGGQKGENLMKFRHFFAPGDEKTPDFSKLGRNLLSGGRKTGFRPRKPPFPGRYRACLDCTLYSTLHSWGPRSQDPPVLGLFSPVFALWRAKNPRFRENRAKFALFELQTAKCRHMAANIGLKNLFLASVYKPYCFEILKKHVFSIDFMVL